MSKRRNKHSRGLWQKRGTWQIDRVVPGHGRIRESTRCTRLEDAEAYLAHRLEQLRRSAIYGDRPQVPFARAAAKYLRENTHKRSLGRDRQDLDSLIPYIGEVPLHRVHPGCPALEAWLTARRRHWAPGSINRALAVLRRVLNLAARAWRHPDGLTWLETAPLIVLEPDEAPRPPYPLTYAEQRLLVAELPAHLARIALFLVNTGTREQEACALRWDWECDGGPAGPVFLIPREQVKNKTERLVVLNSIARRVVDDVRGEHGTYVFSYAGRGRGTRDRVGRLYNTGWKHARARAAARYRAELGTACPDGFARVRVHDLKHTFGRRLRAAGVSLEDRQDLLGHKHSKITTHYSGAELEGLVAAAETVVEGRSGTAPLVLVRRRQN